MRCVALTRICYGSSHWKLAEAFVNLAQGYLQLKGECLSASEGQFISTGLSGSPCLQIELLQRDQVFVVLLANY